MVKQVIVVRKDLNMRKGKIAAQVAHAAMKVFFDKIQFINSESGEARMANLTPEMIEWMEGTFTKVVVSVQSERELFAIKEAANNANLPSSLITDCGFTEFHGVPTNTCVAVGPADAEEVDKITGGLPLL